MKELVIATNNRHKVEEIKAILCDMNVKILSLGDLKIDIEIEETGTTLEENAKIKAKAIFNITGLPTIADDTGLSVVHLKGAPGVYSARYAGENCTYSDNNQKLLKELAGFPKPWKAVFSTVISYISKSDDKTFLGECPGQIVDTQKGIKGFGYDPVFLPDNSDRTYAELEDFEKNKISHRSRALFLLKEFFNKNY